MREIGRKSQHAHLSQNSEEAAEAFKSHGTGLLAVVWIKSNKPFLLSDEKGWTAYSLRAFFKGHGHHLLWALTPDLKGLAEAVALSKGNSCRSSCFPNNTGLLLAGWQAIEKSAGVCRRWSVHSVASPAATLNRKRNCVPCGSTGIGVGGRNGSLIKRQWPEVSLL